MIYSDDSDSSDYNVDDYITPDTVRRTYNKTDDDLISGSNDESDSENEEQTDIKNCTTNVMPEETVVPEVNEPESEDEEEKARTNSRFILHISNINFDSTRASIMELFMEAGEVKAVRVPKKRRVGYCFVEMKDESGYKNAFGLTGRVLDDKKIEVYSGSKNKKHGGGKIPVKTGRTHQKPYSNNNKRPRPGQLNGKARPKTLGK